MEYEIIEYPNGDCNLDELDAQEENDEDWIKDCFPESE